MLDVAIKLLKKIEDNGFQAYIVGGFVRDYVLGITSNDIDICTNAKPKDIRSIFKDACLSNDDYGSITVIIKNVRFEITTFRKEYSYTHYRKPEEYEFVDNLHEDLQRRDFRMNTLCINRDGEILDLLDGGKDIEHKIIHTVGSSYDRLSEDALRILRAIRFATILNFSLSDEIRKAILDTKENIRELSYQRKREELDKIFTSVNVKEGINLLLEFNLDQVLELSKLKEVTNFEDLIGIWAQLDVQDIYPFTKNEKQLITNIQLALKKNNLNNQVLYTYGLYVNCVAANIKGISKKEVTLQYNSLPIKCRSDIQLDGTEISELLCKKPGPYLKEIFKDLEVKILNLQLENEKEALITYLKEMYS